VRRLARTSKMPGVLPSGPQLPPPSYDNIGVDVASTNGIDLAFDQWYRLAGTEFGSLLGCAPQYAAPHFRWLAAAGPCARQGAGATRLSVAWRVLSRRADELAAVCGVSVSPGQNESAIVAWHVRKTHNTASQIEASVAPEQVMELRRGAAHMAFFASIRAPCIP
jgi:hypothetical protein